MTVLNIIGILAKYTMCPRPLGNCSCIALLPAIHGSICSFWANLSGPMIDLFWERFACNHSYGYGYALITGVLPVTLRARFAHVKLFLQFYRRIDQTDSLRFLQNSAFL